MKGCYQNQEDRDAAVVVNSNAERARIRNERLKESQIPAEYVAGHLYAGDMTEEQGRGIVGALARGCTGLIFLYGMAQGAVLPEFAVIGMMACVGWGLSALWRARNG